MITSKLLALSLVAATAAGTTPSTLPAGAAPAPRAADPPVCEAMARAMLRSARQAAYADFWLRIATCFNEHGGHCWTCLREAWTERREALELAGDQYRARLDVCARLGHGSYDPDINPANFTTTIDNRYFPLVPGRTLVYEKISAEGRERTRVTVQSETVEIEGVQCVVVRDTVRLDGEMIEDTNDWYAQDLGGNVWYLGEIAKNYEDGFLNDIEGSWRHGKDDAKAGILMKANPTPGDFYRQEMLLGEAEDVAEVISLGETVTVPAGTFTGCLQTEDTSPLEPDVRERKFYAPGIGVVLELDLETGERTELVRIINS